MHAVLNYLQTLQLFVDIKSDEKRRALPLRPMGSGNPSMYRSLAEMNSADSKGMDPP
jgi:hypothetical protein